MLLSRLAPATKFDIKFPIWKTRSIGLNIKNIGIHNEINILHETKDGKRLYPNPLYISGKKAQSYPMEPVKSNPLIKLYIIPINDLELLERSNV